MHGVSLLVHVQVPLAYMKLRRDLLLKPGLGQIVFHLELIQQRESGRITKIQLTDHLLRLAKLCYAQALLLLMQALSCLLASSGATQVFALSVDFANLVLRPVDHLSLSHKFVDVRVAQLLEF